jgi:hypothetical protein
MQFSQYMGLSPLIQTTDEICKMKSILVGNPSIFAIESGISEAYESRSVLALGFFTIHVGGCCYGRHTHDSTMLACSYNEVEERIANRGRHTASFASEVDAGKIANAFRSAVYADEQDENYFGVPLQQFCKTFFELPGHVEWAPDGDAAFDDGSYVLHFDIGNHVRLIAFKSGQDGLHEPSTLKDIWIPAHDFYDILQRWHDAFFADWTVAPKEQAKRTSIAIQELP